MYSRQHLSMDAESSESVATRHGVDPPRLAQYQATESPQANPGPPYRPARVPSESQDLETIDEAMTQQAWSEGRGGYNRGTFQDFQNSLPYPDWPGTAAGEDTSLVHFPDPADRVSISPRPTSPVISATLPPINRHPHISPPASTAIDQSTALPPTQTATSPTIDDWSKPTCSLNLMCYRPGSQGCIRRQIQVARKSSEEYPAMIQTDQDFFQALHREYEQHICGFWRRYLSLKTLRQIRLLSFTPMTRPEVVPLDDFTLQEIFYAYQHPEHIKTESEWIDWVFRLRQADRRHALEFVEGWSGFRIGLIGSLPWVVATIVGVV